VAEVAFHQRRWLAASGLTGLTARLVEARAAFAGRFADLRGASLPALAADIAVGWPAGQALADQARAQGLDGIVWPSVRDPARGEAYALLDPHGVRAPWWGEAWRLAVDGSPTARSPVSDEPLIAPVS
jgi:RES domain